MTTVGARKYIVVNSTVISPTAICVGVALVRRRCRKCVALIKTRESPEEIIFDEFVGARSVYIIPL